LQIPRRAFERARMNLTVSVLESIDLQIAAAKLARSLERLEVDVHHIEALLMLKFPELRDVGLGVIHELRETLRFRLLGYSAGRSIERARRIAESGSPFNPRCNPLLRLRAYETTQLARYRAACAATRRKSRRTAARELVRRVERLMRRRRALGDALTLYFPEFDHDFRWTGWNYELVHIVNRANGLRALADRAAALAG
jgi:hypothetical protein